MFLIAAPTDLVTPLLLATNAKAHGLSPDTPGQKLAPLQHDEHNSVPPAQSLQPHFQGP